jgi:predicted RecB family nuclease
VKKATRRGPAWVSKTDLTRYVRCPYTFWLLERGEISFEDTVDEFAARLLRQGVEFQATVESSADPMDVEPDTLDSLGPEGVKVLATATVPSNLGPLLQKDVKVLGTPKFENFRLKIHGQPDGIVTAEGALFPIEIKWHKRVQRMDELELAFYYVLLEPYRTRPVKQPMGYLILHTDRGAEEVEVPIGEHRFAEVKRLLKEIREARRYGVTPRVCSCKVCSGVRREEVLEAALDRDDLTLIWNIGRHRAPVLEENGIGSTRELIEANPAVIVALLAEREDFVSREEVHRWQHHAESYERGVPVVFGVQGRRPPSDFIALDLEYDTHIWLVGACLASGDDREYLDLWADTPRQVRKNLRDLDAFIANHSGTPVVTWSGDGADLPRIRAATEKMELPSLEAALSVEHLDVFQYVAHHVRFPIPSLTLKWVGSYLGIPRLSDIEGGLEAQSMYRRYRRARGKQRLNIRQALIDYNHDDLDALIETTRKLADMLDGKTVGFITPYPAPEVFVGPLPCEGPFEILAPKPPWVAGAPEACRNTAAFECRTCGSLACTEHSGAHWCIWEEGGPDWQPIKDVGSG